MPEMYFLPYIMVAISILIEFPASFGGEDGTSISNEWHIQLHKSSNVSMKYNSTLNHHKKIIKKSSLQVYKIWKLSIKLSKGKSLKLVYKNT